MNRGWQAEVDRLRQARDVVANELTTLKRDMPAEAPAELPALLDVHLMLLHDEAMAGATRHWIEVRHYNAEWALSAQLEVVARQFDEMEDDYLRGARPIWNRWSSASCGPCRRQTRCCLRRLEGVAHGDEDPLVLVANDVAPADMLQFKGSVFSGFVTDVGGKTSHTAIVARSMDIPAVVGAREASRLIRAGRLDRHRRRRRGCGRGSVTHRAGGISFSPAPERARSALDFTACADTPSVTLDGVPVELLANIELPARCTGCAGLGRGGHRTVSEASSCS